MKKNDIALWFFGAAALACLLVSLPATLAAMALFHGSYGGIAATLVFEIGAVGAELASLAIPQWRKRLTTLTIVLLVLTTGGNYALGVDHFGAAQDIGTTYAAIRAAGAGWLLAIMSSAIFPALLFVFLTAFTARYRMVKGGYDTPAGALAFWMSSYGQWLNSRTLAAEQRVNTLEQLVSSGEQEMIIQRAATEQLQADYERRLSSVEQEREQQMNTMRRDLVEYGRTMSSLRNELIDRDHAVTTAGALAEQQRREHEQAMSSAQEEKNSLRQRASEQIARYDQLVKKYEQEIADLRHELMSRPEPMTVEVIKVARAQLTLDEAAELFGVSVSTVRRRIAPQNVIEQEA